jgi:MFS family permease
LGPVIGLGYVCFAPIGASIVAELGQPALTGWGLNTWTLASSISFLISGYVSDLVGRRHVLLLGSLLGLCGFVVCAVAHSVSTLIAGQGLLGISTGFLFVTYSAAAEMVDPSWCAVAIGIIDAGYVVPW